MRSGNTWQAGCKWRRAWQLEQPLRVERMGLVDVERRDQAGSRVAHAGNALVERATLLLGLIVLLVAREAQLVRLAHDGGLQPSR